MSALSAPTPAFAPGRTSTDAGAGARPAAMVRRWVGRGTIAVSEQALFAGGNFVLNVTMAATMPPSDYGAFVVAFTTFTIAAGLHNALILEPATVLRTTLYDTRAGSYCRAQVILHAAVTVVLGGVLAALGVALVFAGDSAPVGRALLAASAAAPLILLHWLARRFLYILQRPATALVASAIYFGALASMTLIARLSGVLSPTTGFIILAVASAVAASFLMANAGVFGRIEDGADRLRLRELATERWTYGRWLIGAVCIESAIVPGLTVATTLMLGLGAVGILRAMQVFTVPAGHLLSAVSALALPVLSRDYHRGQWASLRTKTNGMLAAVAAGAVVFEIALLLLHGPLERLVYGGKFAAYAFLIPLVGAASLLDGAAATYAMLLSAVQRPRLYLASLALTVPVTAIAAVVCISLWGITGVALTLVVTAATSVAIRRHLARRSLRASLVTV